KKPVRPVASAMPPGRTVELGPACGTESTVGAVLAAPDPSKPNNSSGPSRRTWCMLAALLASSDGRIALTRLIVLYRPATKRGEEKAWPGAASLQVAPG